MGWPLPAMGIFSRQSSTRPNNNKQPLSSNGYLKRPLLASSTQSDTHERSPPMSTFTVPDVPLPPAPNPNVDPAAYLRSIYAVRERSKVVMAKAHANQLRHFTVDMSKFRETASYVVSIIRASQTSFELYVDFIK